MATPDPKAVAAPTKPPVAPSPAPRIEAESEDVAPQIERVNMSGLVIEKIAYPDGECETKVLKEPTISTELVRSTRALQRARGH